MNATVESTWDLSANENISVDSKPSLDAEPMRSIIPEPKPKLVKKVLLRFHIIGQR